MMNLRNFHELPFNSRLFGFLYYTQLKLIAKALKMDGWKMKSDEVFCRDVPYFQGLFGDI